MAAVTALGFAVSAPATPVSRSSTAASNKAAAESDAPALLSQLVLPAASTGLSSKPAWDLWRDGGCPCEANPNVVDQHSWWQVPGTVDDVIAFVKAHEPAGTTIATSGGGSGPGYVTKNVTFQWPAVSGVLSLRWLVVDARSLSDGSSGVRADGESVWVTPRPASERIPPAKRLRVTVTRGPKLLQVPIEVRSQAKIRKVRALLNGLPAAQPGVRSCPIDRGVGIVLDFFATKRAHMPEAMARIDAGGCGGVTLKLRGRNEPGLDDPPVPASGPYVSLTHRVAAIIGKKLETG